VAKDQTGDQGEAFLREVDEELRRDQLANLWRRYGRWLLIAVGGFLIALAVFLYWAEQRQEKISQQSDRLARAVQLLNEGNAEKALPELQALAGEGSDGIKALARLAEASQFVRADEKEKAISTYEAIAADKSLAEPFRQLASFRAVQLQYDALTPQQAIDKLKPLAQDGTPWFGPAGELLAVAYLDAGQPQLARALFEAISGSDAVPASLRARASQMISMLPQTEAEAAAEAAETAQSAEPPAASPAATEAAPAGTQPTAPAEPESK